MSGFITSSGLDLNSIFQSRPPTDTSQLTHTGFKKNGVDLALLYRPKYNNKYSPSTGFRISDGTDLNSLFEWGGYTPTVSVSSQTSTANTATITVTGNYYIVNITCNTTTSGNVYLNPFSFTSSPHNTINIFNIKAYNGFNIFQEINVSVPTLGPPTITTVSLVSAYNSTRKFSFLGTNFSKIKWSLIDSDNFQSSGEFTGTMVEITNPSGNYTISFTPYNVYNEPGIIVSKVLNNNSAETTLEVVGVSTFQSYPFLTVANMIVVGGGASGGAGGTNSAGQGGGGGGGGAGAYINSYTASFVGTIDGKYFETTVGKGGTGATGNGTNTTQNGDDGNPGLTSLIKFDTTILAAGGGNQGIGGGKSGSNSLGGAGGTASITVDNISITSVDTFSGPSGSGGIRTGGIGGTINIGLINFNGDGGNGGGGGGSGGSGNTPAGKNGYAYFYFIYVTMS